MNFKEAKFLLILGLFAPEAALAADSLSHYLAIAAKNNPTVLQRNDEYQAALQKIPQAGTLPDPELSAGVFVKPMEQMNGDQVADFRLMQMFPWFGVRGAARDEMGLMAKMKGESLRDAETQTAYDVKWTWNELYKTAKEIRIAEKNIEILRTIERLALVKFKSSGTSGGASGPSGNAPSPAPSNAGAGSAMQAMPGGGAPSPSAPVSSGMGGAAMGSSSGGGAGLTDLYRIQIEIGDLENRAALARNRQSVQSARFNGYLNRQPQAPLTLPDTLRPDSLTTPVTAVQDSILKNNPMLGMLAFEQQSLDARRRMATRMGYPMIGLGVNYSLINKSEMSTSSMNGEDMIMPMVTLTLPLYRSRYSSLRREAALLKSAAARGSEAAARSLQTDYYEALQLYQDARRRMKLYDGQSQLAQRTLDIMTKRFSASGGGLNELLPIRQQLLDYEMKQVEAVADNNTAAAWLERLMGLPKTD